MPYLSDYFLLARYPGVIAEIQDHAFAIYTR